MRVLLGGVLISIGALLVLFSFVIAYCYMTRQSYSFLPEISRELDFLSMMEGLLPVISRYITGDVRVLVNAGILALGLLIAQGIGYALITIGGRGLTSRS